MRFGQVDGLVQPFDHCRANGVGLGGEAHHQHAVARGEGAHAAFGFEHGFAQLRRVFAQHAGRGQLALVNVQGGAAGQCALGGVVRAVGKVHAGAVGFQRPGRQRGLAQAVARGDVFLHPAGHLLPAGGLPGFKRANRPAKAPADGQVEVAGVVGHIGRVVGDVVEHIAEARPQELRLRVLAVAQLFEFHRRVGFFQDGLDRVVAFFAGIDVFTLGRVEHQGLLAFFFVDAALGFLPQRAFFNQGGQPGRGFEQAVPRVVGQGVLHGLDHVGKSIQAHHVGSAEGGGFRAAQARAGEVVHHVKADAVFFGIGDGGQHGEHADAVGDKVRGVFGAHHALAQGGDQEALQVVQHAGVAGQAGDDFHQVHIARRVEKVHAAKARAQAVRAGLSQGVDAQARGVGGKNAVFAQVRRHLVVQVGFPVHAFGDGFNHQVAVFEQVQVFFVVGRGDVVGAVSGGQRGRLELFQVGDGFQRDAAFVAFFGRQVEQHGLHLGVDQVGGDLRPHHTGAEHGHLAYVEFRLRHGYLSLVSTCETGGVPAIAGVRPVGILYASPPTAGWPGHPMV